MLNIQNLYAGYTPNTYILRDFSLQLHAGERIGIVGQNGCGKSTLAKALMGMLSYTQGNATWQEHINLLQVPVYQKNNLGIAYFMQGGRVFGELSVQDNLKMAFLNNQKNTTFEEAMSSLQAFDIPLFTDKRRGRLPAMNLSGGEKHLLSFGMVVLGTPEMKLLIADEPSAGVAAIGQKQILQLMSEVLAEQNTALLLIEQNREFLKELTDKTVEIKTD